MATFQYLFGLLRHPRQFLAEMRQIGEYRGGEFRGTDAFGNRYFECRDPDTIWARERYVLYARPDENASQIPAEWHLWLHRTHDLPPTVAEYPFQSWQTRHVENLTGTRGRYVAYSTTRPKYEAWKPKQESPIDQMQESNLIQK